MENFLCFFFHAPRWTLPILYSSEGDGVFFIRPHYASCDGNPLVFFAWGSSFLVPSGLLFTLLDLLQLREFALRLEDLWGGRVGTFMSSNPRVTDPFVLLAHHRHSFWPFDPFRLAFKFILPEGFPAHPHRGFQTVTYVMRVSGRCQLCSFFYLYMGYCVWMMNEWGVTYEKVSAIMNRFGNRPCESFLNWGVQVDMFIEECAFKSLWLDKSVPKWAPFKLYESICYWKRFSHG